MKGIKLGIFAICVGILGLSVSSNNVITLGCGCIAVLLSIIAIFIDNKKE